MYIIAFSLGLLGSLHCIGMCGPLVLSYAQHQEDSIFQNFLTGLKYHSGRIMVYALLGMLFGALGSFLILVQMQKYLSIILGLILILSFLYVRKSNFVVRHLPFIDKLNNTFNSLINKLFQRFHKMGAFVMGLINGLLPCGLVYLAIAGAITLGGTLDGIVFMALFGMGTMPALLSLTLGVQLIKPSIRTKFRKLLPYVNLLFGIFLLYRGIVVELPTDLNFIEAINDPIMCH